MKRANKIIVVATLLTAVWAGVASAQGAIQERGRKWCRPTGTWIGQNETYELEFVVTIEPTGGRCYSVVSEGIENVPPWEVSTAWRGALRKTGNRTFSWVQVTFAGPSQLTDPGEGVPDVAGIRGEMTMLDCDHFEVEFEPTELYAWGQIPFEDPPAATMPPSIAHYTRVPMDCGDRTE